MRCFNLDQLADNPLEALECAADSPVLILEGDLPQAVLFHLDTEAAPEGPELKLALAHSLFKAGSLSLGRAAEVASVPVAYFIQHLSRLGTSIGESSENAADSDIVTLGDWLASS